MRGTCEGEGGLLGATVEDTPRLPQKPLSVSASLIVRAVFPCSRRYHARLLCSLHCKTMTSQTDRFAINTQLQHLQVRAVLP